MKSEYETGGIVLAPRFDRSERYVHWSTALFFLVLLGTGVLLFVGPLAAVVGHRYLIATVHLYSGLAVLIPFVVAYFISDRSTRLRSHVTHLSIWKKEDTQWLRSLPRFAGSVAGPFNAGQKLNANVNLAGLSLMLITGLIMASYLPLAVPQREGATLVHDLVGYVLTLLFIGHLVVALSHPKALNQMIAKEIKNTKSSLPET